MKTMRIYHVAKPVLQLGSVLSITMDMGLSLGPSMTPKLGYSWPSSNSDGTIPSTSRLRPLATYMFGPHRGLSLPVRTTTLRDELLIRKE